MLSRICEFFDSRNIISIDISYNFIIETDKKEYLEIDFTRMS